MYHKMCSRKLRFCILNDHDAHSLVPRQRLTHLSDIAALPDEEEVEVAEVVVDAGAGEVVAGRDVDPEWSENTLRCINIKVSIDLLCV